MTPTGKGVFLWQLDHCFNGDMVKLANALIAAKVTWVAVKAANGYASFNTPLLRSLISNLRAAGIAVWGWHYVYGIGYTGVNISKFEGDMAVQRIGDYLFDGWIIDAESEYKRSGSAAAADTYLHIIRGRYPQIPLALCSYRWPSYHKEFPWANFLAHVDLHMPQVYWVGAHNPGAQLAQSYKELNALKRLPFVPVGAAYTEGEWKGPTPDELDQFDQMAHTLKLPGVSWWSWDSQGIQEHPEWLARIAAHVWGAPPEPKVSWAWEVTNALRSQNFKIPDPPESLW